MLPNKVDGINQLDPQMFFFLSACFCCLVSLSIEKTPSARLSKLENYGFDQLVSQRDWYHLLNEKSGFWGTCLSWRDVRGRIYEGCVGEVANRVSGGSFRGGRWRYLPFRHHDNRYSADWIRRYPGLSKIQKTGTAVQSLTRLPVLIEPVGRAVSNETETINRNMDTIMMKLTALEVKLGDFRDQNGQREWAALCSCSPQSHNNLILSFLAPRTGALAKAVWITTLWERWSLNLFPPSPNYGHYSPPPFNCLCKNALYRHLSSRSVDRRRNKWHWTGWLLARAGYVSPCCKSCVYGICAFVLRCFFFCSQTVLQMEHSLGVKKFFFLLSLLM